MELHNVTGRGRNKRGLNHFFWRGHTLCHWDITPVFTREGWTPGDKKNCKQCEHLYTELIAKGFKPIPEQQQEEQHVTV